MEGKRQIDLLLIGKTANGKSATGNSILRKKAFKSSGSTTSVTNKIDYDVAEFDGRVIKVVDAPGVCDNSVKESEAVNLVLTCLQDAMAMNPEGYHAFVLVIKFGGRFTGEEKKTITILKQAFGENFVRDFCILVMSCGDAFKEEVKSEGMSFKEWCKLEKGQFQDLLNECGGRIVLFDNRTKDENKKAKQLMKLIEKVDKLPNKGKRYTDENFEMARNQRDLLRMEAKEPFIRQQTLEETGLIIGMLQRLQQQNENHTAKIESLYKLLNRDNSLVKNIKEHDNKCRRFKDLVETAESLGSTISEEVNLTKKICEEDDKMLRKQETVKQKEAMLAKSRLEAEKAKEEAKRLEAEKEQIRLQAELDRIKREKEEVENKRLQEINDEKERHRKTAEAMELKYQEMKTEQNASLAGQVFSKVAVPVWGYVKKWCSG